jgi:hypothetical protein
MAGESLTEAYIEKKGLLGDRFWAIRDEIQQETSSVRKHPALLKCKAQYIHPPNTELPPSNAHVEIEMPCGQIFTSQSTKANDLLSDYLHRKVSLQALRPASDIAFYRSKTINGKAALKKQFNTKVDLPSFGSISWIKMLELSFFSTPLGRFYDCFPLHLMTDTSLAHISRLMPDTDSCPQRFRPNLLIHSCSSDTEFEEFKWVGGKLIIGEVVLKCESRTVRCSMPAQPQSGISKNKYILRALEKYSERHLGINISVIKPGQIHLNDQVVWQPESRFSIFRLTRPWSNKIKNTIIQGCLRWIDFIQGKTSKTQ